MSRKLATIQTIAKLEPIPNADTIETASILGWKCVVKKEEFKEGDSIVYFEIDSFLPVRPEFEFLRKNCYKHYEDGREGFRIKTIRLRKQISQGLIMPINILPTDQYAIGQDVSEILNVNKYEPPMPKCLMGIAKGMFPGFLVKTDEVRVQILQEVLNRHIGLECYVTEKIDGASCTFYLKDGEFGVCSRNIDLKEDDTNALWKWARENKLEEKTKEMSEAEVLGIFKMPKNFALQGEFIGPGIQENPLKLYENEIRFFNVFDIDNCKFFDFVSFEYIIDKMRLKAVPIVNRSFNLINSIDELVKMSVGLSKVNPKVQREGIVIRPRLETMDLGMSVNVLGNTGRLSFKVVSPEYLIEVEQ